MEIQAYKKYWSDKDETLLTYSPIQVDETKVDGDTFSFLTSWGLPSQAAPFLSFDLIQEGKLWTPNQVFKIDFEGLDSYLMIGSNGSGDPICIDTSQGNEIVYLNHDNYFERIFINKSVLQFAICLIKYQDFFASLINPSPDDFSKRKFADEEFSNLRREFIDIDRMCLADNSFWSAELEGLLWERDNE
jgi:hypothetical protein